MGDLLNLAIYNPAILSDDDFLRGFVARQTLAERLLRRLGDLTPGNLAQHHLLIGQRGMGKTSLLRRMALGVAEDPGLSAVLLPLTFREEQYNVHNLHVFWCNCLDALGDWFENTGQSERAEALDAAVAVLSRGTKDREGRAAHDAFADWMRREGRRAVLFLDNIDIILGGLKKQEWSLRRVLQEAGGIVVVGASAAYMEALADHKAAFFDFFQVTVLEKLSHGDLVTCLRSLARERGEGGRNVLDAVDNDPGRIHTLYDLTGGNPRTLSLLYLLLEMDGDGDVFADLERLLDQVTVLYKARVEDLAPQARVVMDALALHWNPATAKTIAAASGLSTQVVSSHLDRMGKDGLVEKVSISTSNRTAFQVAERFFNIWYLMRHAPRRQRTRLKWLTGFLRSFYTADQLMDRAKWFLRLGDDVGSDRRDHFLALSGAMDDPAWRKLLGAEAIAMQRSLVGDGEDVEALVREFEASTPETAEEWLRHGLLLVEHTDRHEDAETALRRSIDLDPEPGNSWFFLGVLLHLRFERYEEAEIAYVNALDREPSQEIGWSNLGELLHYDLKRHDEAESALRRAVLLNPTPAGPWFDLGFTLGALKSSQGRDDTFRHATVAEPTTGSDWVARGVGLFLYFDRPEEAAHAFEQALKFNPGEMQIRRELLVMHLVAQGTSQAIDDEFDAVVADLPPYGTALLEALRAMARENFGEASEAFHAALLAEDQEIFGTFAGAFVAFMRLVVAKGYGNKLIRYLEEQGADDRFWTILGALDAFTNGEERLSDLNPEVRGAAAKIFALLQIPKRNMER
jgi:tetratricopeptide (TPR) repeat protein